MDFNQGLFTKLRTNQGKGFSVSRVTRHASLSTFSGNWLVNFDPQDYNNQEILLALAKIKDNFEKKAIKFKSINIIFKKSVDKNQYFKENDAIYLILHDIDGQYQEIFSKPAKKAEFKALPKPIRTISLLFPKVESYPRWRTMGLPAGQMFLASALNANGFKASPMPLVIPGDYRPSEALSADMAGITLFEDLLPLLGPFLADFRASYDGIMAVGGPFPTLAPDAATFHLPQADLIVRGEAELALPGILQALNQGDEKAFFAYEGVLWRRPGVLAMAGFDRVNRPERLRTVPVSLDFLKKGHLEQGLEMNFSRGCRRGCVFCCRAQGARFRKLPLDKADELLSAYRRKAAELGMADKAGTVNVNDDDILQDPEYAAGIFALFKRRGMRMFGVQTSTASLAGPGGAPNKQVLDMVADRDLYVGGDPLLWLGTDAFLPHRAARLGKKLPPPDRFRELLDELERRRIRHYHYWISSDGETTWTEFVEELGLIFSFFRGLPGFGLLAHAPFIVPYPSSALFKRIGPDDPRLKVKLNLDTPDARFRYRVIKRLETSWPQLNALLRNEKAGGEQGFFDFLKEKDLLSAAQLAYHFLKQEIFRLPKACEDLSKAKNILEKMSGELIERKN